MPRSPIARTIESRTVTVAVADDDPRQRRLLELLVGRLGYEVVCSAADGDQLLRACAGMTVDVAIVDLDMPKVDGLEAAEALVEAGVSVILVSGMPDVGEIVVDREPVDAVLAKPVTGDRLRAAIDSTVS